MRRITALPVLLLGHRLRRGGPLIRLARGRQMAHNASPDPVGARL